MTEVMIIDGVRTPIGKMGGALSSVRPDDLLAETYKALIVRTGIDAAEIAEVIAGCGNQAGEDNRDVARMSALLAGFPKEVPGVTVNRNCSSALEAVNFAAKTILVGEGELAIICWGSISAVAKETGERLRQSGQACRVISLRLIAPLQTDRLLEALDGCSRILVVEQSHGAQFMAWLRAHVDFPCAHQSLALAGPLPIRPSHILNAFDQWETHAQEVQHVANC